MKKKYIGPRVDAIGTGLESEILIGSSIGGGIDEGSNARARDSDLDDFTGESMRGGETGGNN